MRGSHIGEFEELVLMAVAALDGQGYGLTVRNLLQKEVNRNPSLGATHATLYRLEDKGLLRSDLKDATAVRGGRRKRVFTLTSAGFEALRTAQEARTRLWSLIPVGLRPEVSP